MNRFIVTLFVLCSLVIAVSAQKNKPWTDWSERDAKRILDDSAWAQTQTETDTSQMFYTPTTTSSKNSVEGVTNQATSVNFHIRFLSAKPIRQALARVGEIEAKGQLPNLRAFAERNFDNWIVVSVSFDSKDGRYAGTALQAFNSANIGVLKNGTYLERKDGKRLFLEDYKAPIGDGLGAKFVFPRFEDGKPFITSDTREIRFYSEVPSPSRTDTNVVQSSGRLDPKTATSGLAVVNSYKLNMKFKVDGMMYDGRLEY